MKRDSLLITGASGYLGRELLRTIESTDNQRSVIAVTSNKKALREDFPHLTGLNTVSREKLFEESFPWERVNTIVHLAFARRFRPDWEIADSIDYARRVFCSAKKNKVPLLLYISSQGVYGNTEEIRTIETKPAPAMIYTMAKYAGEEVLHAIFDHDGDTQTLVFRLDSLAGNQKMLPAFVQQAIETKQIRVVGGSQIFSFLDVRDAASAILAGINTPLEKLKPLYNVGWNRTRYSILELANLVAAVAEERYNEKVDIVFEKKDLSQFAGMDSSDFMQDTGWRPQYDMRKIIGKLFDEYHIKQQER